MGEFIGFLKSNWGSSSQVSQRLRRLRQLVVMVQGVADAAEGRPAVRRSSVNCWLQLLRKEALRGQAVLDATSDPSAVVGAARKFLAGVKALFVCSAEVDRLTDAVDALEQLTGPGGDLDFFLKLLQLDAADAAMDVDDSAPALAAARYGEGGSSNYSVATALGAKRKRGGSSGVHQASDDVDYDGDVEAASHGRVLRKKRRGLACKRHTRSGPPMPAGPARSVPVAEALVRVRRRIGRPC
jgi:hypothetical protein